MVKRVRFGGDSGRLLAIKVENVKYDLWSLDIGQSGFAFGIDTPRVNFHLKIDKSFPLVNAVFKIDV